MTDEQEMNHAVARSRSNAGLGGSVAQRDEFLAGICVALQVVTAMDCGVTWAEIVRTAGINEMLLYAAHIEPDEWELAGFKKYAMQELRRGKPRKVPNVEVTGAARLYRAASGGPQGYATG